jgi:ABC-2 type transport system ATP-binding protein
MSRAAKGINFMKPCAIKSEGLTKKFGDFTAVENLSFEISPGEIFAFLGPNGAGKTTTVKLMSGLLIPSSGTAWINGCDIVKDQQKAKQSLGYVSDQPFVYPHLTGFEFMRFVGDIYSVDEAYQKAKIPELLEMFELSKYADETTESYSHGMRQKLVIASVLLHSPSVLFLDEPLVGLDPKSARLVKEIFIELSGRGVAIFMCTHVLEIAEKLAGRAGIIHKGRLIALESISELKQKIKHGGNLEDVFLEITGGTQYIELLKYL